MYGRHDSCWSIVSVYPYRKCFGRNWGKMGPIRGNIGPTWGTPKYPKTDPKYALSYPELGRRAPRICIDIWGNLGILWVHRPIGPIFYALQALSYSFHSSLTEGTNTHKSRHLAIIRSLWILYMEAKKCGGRKRGCSSSGYQCRCRTTSLLSRQRQRLSLHPFGSWEKTDGFRE